MVSQSRLFIFITFFTAFLIEALGTAIGVQGFGKLLGFEFVIIALVISFDLGKLTTVTLLYRHWEKLSIAMRSYGLLAIFVTMLISSAGAFAYLSGKFQTSIIGTQEGAIKVNVLKEQQAKYEERKKQIDLQIASLPEKTTVNQRLRLINGFKAEQTDLQNKISQIDTELPALQVKQISTEAEAGPILYVAKAFNVPVEVAVKYVIGLIIIVFNPLAVFLVVAGNFLILERAKNKIVPDVVESKNTDTDSFELDQKGDEIFVGDLPEPMPVHQEPISEKEITPQFEMNIKDEPDSTTRSFLNDPVIPNTKSESTSEEQPSGLEKITLDQVRKTNLPRSSLEDVDIGLDNISFIDGDKPTKIGMKYEQKSGKT